MKEVSVSLLNPFAPRSHFHPLPFTRTTLIHSNQSSSSSSSISFALNTPFLPTISRCFNLLRHHSNPNFKFTRRVISNNMKLGLDGFSDSNIDSELPVDLSYTSTLPPALTLQHGLIKIKEAIEKLKSNPPRSTSGLLRFQVAVPPDTKASSWLGSESQSSEVFPQFYLSKMDSDNKTLDPCLVNGALGIWGIGAAVYFSCSSSCDSRNWNLMKRYLSVDSPLVTAYGFIGIDFDTEASSVRHDIGSFFLFIPQIELHEYGSASLLAATLAWNDASFCNFSTAVRSTELSLHQAVNHFSSKEIYQNKCINSTLKQLDRVDVEMVYINEHSQFGKGASTNHGIPLILEGAQSSSQFYLKHSPTVALTSKMLDHPGEISCSVQSFANINALWASLIIEECSRLGLTYFCIAPGSRSSPLAVAAASHPLASCISCFDERSLAFHALGYGRGSCKPAVVITSSGTAVSNLLPAVVEASQDCVPLLLLTADRPPELLDAGANQAIDQVNHFGSFVRHFFSLPPPTDDIPARMVLTAVDSAVCWATNAPSGPVHINCAFREPLECTPRQWGLSCLKGLELWISNTKPFTKYIKLQQSSACSSIPYQMAEVVKLIQGANKGLLLIGGIHSENELWAALLLAKHLSWPVVADILSGLRFRKVLTSFFEINEKLIFVDHLDHALLSESVRGLAHADVIIQIGSRITSKRISQMIELCSPCSYIMVEEHPYRHDPSHLVSHRIQSSIAEFADCLLKVHFPRMTISKWKDLMQDLNKMVAWEIEFQIGSECSLTEPHVAHIISEALPSDAALFIGNSMVIRDADMYGRGWAKHTTNTEPTGSSWELPCLGIRVSGNRGASGIDGLLSTAIGFAVGCNKRVFCIVGDISFLYDTNGLAILNQRSQRKPMTILVINNHGGAIFRLLPIADVTQQSILNQYFYTSHNTSISKLCEAHSIKHLEVGTKMELQKALSITQHAQTDCVIEVQSGIEENANFHRTLRVYARQAADHAVSFLSRLSIQAPEVHRMEYSLYRIQLSAPPTSSPHKEEPANFYREGFILSLYLDDGNVGFGEVAPLEIHKESLIDVEEQLRFLSHVIRGTKISYLLPLLKGSFSSWIWENLGLPAHSIFPSVRCGLEMAILNGLAARQGCSLSNLLLGRECSTPDTQFLDSEETIKSSGIEICALISSDGSPEEIAQVAAKLVDEGFTTIKLKVARRESPFEDAAVIQEIRKKVGYQIKLRADANRNWTYEEACQFASSVKSCDLQYIEEPVHSEDDIIKFCVETGIPVALDETVDNIQGDPLNSLSRFAHQGIVAFVIKPAVVGGFENAAFIAKWAQQKNKMAVVSAAFESTLSLSAYIQFSYYLEQTHRGICKVENRDLPLPVAHGLGTYQWLCEDVMMEPLKILGRPHNDVVEASLEDASRALHNFKIDDRTMERSYSGENIRTYQLKVNHGDFTYSLKVRESGTATDNNVLVFLHGFLGTGEDWIPVMKALSLSARCISIDFPGHGESKIHNNGSDEAEQEPSMSMEVISTILTKLIREITDTRVVIVGYSMGARVALYMSLHYSDQINGAVVISGSPGIKDDELRIGRVALDDSRARFLTEHGLQFFLDTWYSGGLWKSFRAHPQFEQIVSSRVKHKDIPALAKALSDLSIGRQESLWEELKQTKKPMLFVVGEKDSKFKKIAQEMYEEVARSLTITSEEIQKPVEIPDCGHAVHLENPLSLINAISKFLTKIR